MTLARKIALIIALLVTAAYFGLINLVAPRIIGSIIPEVPSLAAQYVNGQVSVGSILLSNSLELTATDVIVKDRHGQEVATVPSIVVGLSPWRALMGGEALRAISSIIVNSPVVHVYMDKNDKWNVADIIKESKERNTSFRSLVHINNGYLMLNTPYGKWEGGLQGDIDASGNPQYALDLDVAVRNEIISLTGKIDADTKGALTIKTASFNLSEFGTLISHYIPVKELQGSIKDLQLLWKNDGKVGMSGAGYFAAAAGVIVHEDERLPLTLEGKVLFREMSIKADNLNVALNKEKAQVNGTIDFSDSTKPVAQDLVVTLKQFDLSHVLHSSPVEGAISGKLELNGTLNKITVRGDLKAPALVVGSETLRNVQVPIAMKEDKIVIAGAEAEYGDGKVSLLGEYGQEKEDIVAYLHFSGVNLAAAVGSDEAAVADGDVTLVGLVSDGHLKLNTVADIMTIKWQGHIFQNFAFDVDLFKDTFTINNLSCFSDNGGAVVVSGDIADYVFDLHVRASNLPMTPFLRLADQEGQGNFSGSFSVTGPKASLRIAGMAAVTDGELYRQKIIDAHGFVSYQNGVIGLKSLLMTMEQGAHELNGTIDVSNGDDPILALHIRTEQARLDGIADFYDPQLQLTGNITNEMDIKGALSALQIDGELHAYDGSCKKLLVDDVKGEYHYNKGALTLRDFKVATLTTQISLEGTMSEQGVLDFKVDAKNIRLKRLPHLDAYGNFEGSVDFFGNIIGTKNLPMFSGDVYGASVKINGEEIQAVKLNFSSNGGTVNHFKGTLAQAAGGTYEADLLLDLGRPLLQGKVTAKNVNLHSLLNMVRMQWGVAGVLNGTADINPGGQGSGARLLGTIDNGSLRGVAFQDIKFDLFSKHGFLTINTLKAVEKDGGFMAASGSIDMLRRVYKLNIDSKQVDARLLTAFMENPVSFGGQIDFSGQLEDSFDNPTANATMKISQGQMAGVAFDRLYGELSLKNDMFNLKQLELQKGIYKASATGILPQDLLRPVAERRNPDAQMNVEIKLNEANLAILPTITKWIEWAEGVTHGGIVITGTLEKPLLNGGIIVKDGTIKVKTMSTLIEKVNVNVDFNGERIDLRQMTAQIGKEGFVNATGNFGFTEAETSPYMLNFAAKKVQIKSTYFDGTVNFDGIIKQKHKRAHITSKVRLDDVFLNIPSIPELGDGNSRIGLDVELELGPRIHLYNKYLYDLWLAGGLKIAGSTNFPIVHGTIEANKGTISYLRTPFAISFANVAFPTPGTFMPSVNIEAKTKFNRYIITAKVHGQVDEGLDFKLSSQPPKTQKELVRLLTLKSEVDSSGGIGQSEVEGLVEVGLQMTFLGDVENYVKNTFKLDEFRIYSGNVTSGIGFDRDSFTSQGFTYDDKKQYNILISKYIFKNFMIGYSTSFDQVDRSIFAEYNIGPKFSLSFSQDEKRNNWYGMQYRTSF